MSLLSYCCAIVNKKRNEVRVPRGDRGIFILTGEVHAGKTSWLKQFVRELKVRSLRYHGFLSEAVLEGYRPVGYSLLMI